MQSIKDIYKIGNGPSSSHTIGPERAAEIFRGEHPDAEQFEVVLYGSLAKTGRGHGTDRVLRQTLSPVPTEIIFSEDTEGFDHPNTLDFYAWKGGERSPAMRVCSVGGGDIRIEGRPGSVPPEVYPENSFAEILEFCRFRGISLWQYAEINEDPGLWDFLASVWSVMKQSIDDGLAATGILPGGLRVERKAKFLYEHELANELPQVRECRIICSYAYAVSEQNADCGAIVTAPTCGSCGVLPSVLRYMQQQHDIPDEQVLRALATGGIIGSLVKRNASISGATCGCQAEIGTACAMAAAALCELCNLDLEKIQCAAEVALEHHLGLTCDPICGLVQIPCIERNAVAAMRAMNCLNLSYFLSGTQRISFDMVVKTMYETGVHLSEQYRETAEGGLAKLYNRRGS